MIYIMNPGEGHDVVTFDDKAKAEKAHVSFDGPSRLYSFSGKQWREFSVQGSWYPCNRDNLPVKVLDAGASLT